MQEMKIEDVKRFKSYVQMIGCGKPVDNDDALYVEVGGVNLSGHCAQIGKECCKVPNCDSPHVNPVCLCEAGSYPVLSSIVKRGAQHSLNDGNRDTRWAKADRAVKRIFAKARNNVIDAMYSGLDEVGHFVAKCLVAMVVVYAILLAAIHFYG